MRGQIRGVFHVPNDRLFFVPGTKGGFLPAPIAVLWNMPLSRPQGVAIVGIYPCGKARKRRPHSGAD